VQVRLSLAFPFRFILVVFFFFFCWPLLTLWNCDLVHDRAFKRDMAPRNPSVQAIIAGGTGVAATNDS
jgi:hypothetical protein